MGEQLGSLWIKYLRINSYEDRKWAGGENLVDDQDSRRSY